LLVPFRAIILNDFILVSEWVIWVFLLVVTLGRAFAFWQLCWSRRPRWTRQSRNLKLPHTLRYVVVVLIPIVLTIAILIDRLIPDLKHFYRSCELLVRVDQTSQPLVTLDVLDVSQHALSKGFARLEVRDDLAVFAGALLLAINQFQSVLQVRARYRRVREGLVQQRLLLLQVKCRRGLGFRFGGLLVGASPPPSTSSTDTSTVRTPQPCRRGRARRWWVRRRLRNRGWLSLFPRELSVEVCYALEPRCVLELPVPLEKQLLELGFDIGIGSGFCCREAQSLEEGLVSKCSLEPWARIGDQSIEESECAELSVDVSVFPGECQRGWGE